VKERRNVRRTGKPGDDRTSLKRSTQARTPGYFDGCPKSLAAPIEKGLASSAQPRDITGNVQLYVPKAGGLAAAACRG
jgi:hypothetical protein